jgi:hypothetical protein
MRLRLLFVLLVLAVSSIVLFFLIERNSLTRKPGESDVEFELQSTNRSGPSDLSLFSSDLPVPTTLACCRKKPVVDADLERLNKDYEMPAIQISQVFSANDEAACGVPKPPPMHTRFVFVIGIEGSGHHLYSKLIPCLLELFNSRWWPRRIFSDRLYWHLPAYWDSTGNNYVIL